MALLLQAGSYEDLVKYLIMVRKKAKDSKVDTELVYAYAKTKQLGPLEEFISSPNQANLQVSFSIQLLNTCTIFYGITKMSYILAMSPALCFDETTSWSCCAAQATCT